MQAYVNTLAEGRLYDLMSRQRKKEIDDLRRTLITDLLRNFTLVSYMIYIYDMCSSIILIFLILCAHLMLEIERREHARNK